MTIMDAMLSLVTAGEGVAAAHARGLRSKVMITKRDANTRKRRAARPGALAPDQSGGSAPPETKRARTDMQLIRRSLPGFHTPHTTTGNGVSLASTGGAA